MTNFSKPARPIARNGYWYFVRRVPKRLIALTGKSTITTSTGLAIWQDPKAVRARTIVRKFDEELQQHWDQLLTGAASPDLKAHRDNVRRAGELKLAYAPNSEIATTNLPDILNRFSLLIELWGERTLMQNTLPHQAGKDIAAVLGETNEANVEDTTANIMVSHMIKQYADIKQSELAKKSPRQLAKWHVNRQSALDLFIDLIGGDKPFKHLTRKDAQTLRKHWQTRIQKSEIRINSANREIRNISGLYSTIKTYHQIDGPKLFENILIPGGKEGKRIPFDPVFVQKHYLAEGQFRDLNPEARRIIYLCIETGIRLSEACALNEKTINLSGPIPYIDIIEDGRQTKTDESIRRLPLVGVALLAMKAQPKGFPRYFDNADAASALINKALDYRKLRPGGKKQTLYSMRHTIIDRLKAVEAPKDIQEDILGHKHMYGDGTTLEHKHRWLQKIAFMPPKEI